MTIRIEVARQVVLVAKGNVQLKKDLREKIGSKPDMSIRIVSDGKKPLGFSACETASYYGGPADKKYYYESRIKLPKMLIGICKK